MDVSCEASVQRGWQEIEEQTGSKVQILVANAGLQVISSLQDLRLDQWNRVMDVNLTGAFLVARRAMQDMTTAGGGKIIFVGSVHSKTASVMKAPYVASKHALLGLCRVLAKEGAKHGIHANVVCPGFVKTELVEKQIPEQAKRLGISEHEVVKNVMLKDTVDGEFTTVEEVAEVCTFLAGFPSGALTGQSLIVSHGWVME
jgi:3-hydroxybutyrate dehydrogenase